MSKTLVDRGSLTNLLIENLQELGFPVGDAEAPEIDEDSAEPHAGWNGEPNSPGSTFVPYLVLTPQTATISSGSFADPQDGWQIPYSLATFGATRQQVEALANRARKVLRSLSKLQVTLDGEDFKIQQLWYPAMGGIGRVDATYPSTFGEVDTVTVWISQ